jgi:hypothetical protein
MCLLGGSLDGRQRGSKSVFLGSKAERARRADQYRASKLTVGCLEKAARADACSGKGSPFSPFYWKHFKMVVSLGEA